MHYKHQDTATALIHKHYAGTNPSDYIQLYHFFQLLLVCQ